ncbi:hypothetical protein H4582DRAFT_1921002 [Lactarius indigo]|nr:hypothetical protein H4582DRAFT_1921002 [Lactarius indigo]
MAGWDGIEYSVCMHCLYSSVCILVVAPIAQAYTMTYISPRSIQRERGTNFTLTPLDGLSARLGTHAGMFRQPRPKSGFDRGCPPPAA